MWWKSAYDKYADLSRIFGISPQPVSLVHGDLNLHFRPVTELEINSLHVALGDPMAKTKSEFTPAPSVVPVIPKTNLLRFDFDQLGISLIGSDEILAIVLSGKYAPSISVREAGVGNRSHKLSIGMSTKELDQLMQDSDYDFRQLADPKINYRFYKDVGIAVLVRDGLIAEIVISQIPKDNTGLI